ncbi:MAG: ROK family protein, partial [Myxococcota bacterium]
LMTFNPKVLVLGGGVLNTAPSLVARGREEIESFAWTSFLEAAIIAPSALGDDAGILGAGLIARDEAG